MNSDRIEQLLRDADEMRKRSPEQTPADLASAVLTRRRSRARRRLGAGVAMLLIGGLIPFAVVRQSVEPENIAIKPTPQQTNEPRDEMAEIQAQIDQTELTIARLLAAEKMNVLNARLAEVRRLPTPDDVTERAAAAMVYQTDRMLKATNLQNPARETYSQVIASFPQTPSAEVARRRLLELKNEG